MSWSASSGTQDSETSACRSHRQHHSLNLSVSLSSQRTGGRPDGSKRQTNRYCLLCCVSMPEVKYLLLRHHPPFPPFSFSLPLPMPPNQEEAPTRSTGKSPLLGWKRESPRVKGGDNRPLFLVAFFFLWLMLLLCSASAVP